MTGTTSASLAWSPSIGDSQLAALLAHTMGEQRRLERRLRELESSDSLTGVATRARLLERLAEVLGSHDPDRTRRIPVGALLLLDLDDFKLVNELYGHTHGDGLLVEAARRLELVAGQFEGSCLARFGGDEFALLLPDASYQEARWVCAGLLNRLRQPVLLGSAEIEVGTSIGMVMLYAGDGGPDAALRDGDLAMHAAKAAGKNCWRLFEPAMHEDLVARLTLESELALALDEDEFTLVYQPLVPLAADCRLAVEALVRWHHPERGIVPPDEFLSVAERGPLIHRLGAWALRSACRQLMDWTVELGPATIEEVAVNVSPRQLHDPHFADVVADALAETGADPSRVELEITESTVMAPNSLDQLQRLRALGVRLAIDDFGTGHSSLGRLAALPVDALKIDRSFVQVIPDAGDAPLIRAMVAMAHSLGLSVVAEGIETERQRQYLTDLGCERGQGYLFSRPVRPEQLIAFLADRGIGR